MNPLMLGLGLGALYLFTRGSGDAPPGSPPPLPGTQEGEALRQLGEKLDADLRARGAQYDRTLLRAFQAAARILVDGLYGPESALALARATGRTAPPPIFLPKEPDAPNPTPPTQEEVDETRKVAKDVAQDLKAKAQAYDRDLMKRFQRLARLTADGMYGPATAGALQYFTGETPPKPIYASAGGSRDVKPYHPPK